MIVDIQKLWNVYWETVVNPSASIMERKVAKRAFFAGACAVRDYMHAERIEAELAEEDANSAQLGLTLVGGRDHDDK